MAVDAAREVYVVCVLAYAVIVYIMLTRAIRLGRPLSAVVWCWMASPVPLFAVAWGVEQRGLATLVDPRVQSWAFLFGDIVFLPFMAAMLALGWRRLSVPLGGSEPKTAWYNSLEWRLLPLMAGFAAGLVFRAVDVANYVTAAFNSPTKLLHDYGSYSVLFGALTYGLWPVLLRRPARKWGLVALLGFVLWLGAGVADNTVHQLDGRNLHVQYDWQRMRPIPY